MDFEPLTTAEQKIVDEIENMFGNKDLTLKNIVLYTRLKDLYPDDEELQMKLNKLKYRVKLINEVTMKSVYDDLKCLDKDGNIVSIDNV
jgi:hypothetical protein